MADYDIKLFNDIKVSAREMEQDDSERNNLYDAMNNLYWMKWKEEEAAKDNIKNIKITRSPLARNSIMGAMRLLTAADPIISVPSDINKPGVVQVSSKLEKFMKAIWFASGRISGDPLHNDVVRSALLYSEIIIGINSTKDMVEMSTNPIVKRRMKEINAKTPFLFEVWSPRSCNTRRDKFGVIAFQRKIETNIGHILDVYGQEGLDAVNSHKRKKAYSRSDKCTLHIFYDLQYICIWMDGYESPIKMEEHKLPFIPVVSQTVEGSPLFENTEFYTKEPFLYTLERTNLVERQNLMLTTLYSMLFSIGANPMFVDFTINPEDAPVADYTEPGGVLHYRVGERRESMARQIIDPTLMQGWEISQSLEAQSTIYKQTLGEPLGANAPYSMVALLSQSGRLPLVSTQRKAGWAIAEALEVACKWMKSDNVTAKAKYEKISEEITPSDIPDDFDVRVTLEIELPTDRLQAANAANMLAQGDNPMVSQRWARENVLNIGQSEDMDKEIWNERATNIFFQKWMYEQLADLAKAKQEAMQPGVASGIPGAQPPTNQPPMQPPPMMPGGGPIPPQMGTPPQPNSPEQVEPMEPMEPMPPLNPPMMPRG